jgi:hypothetical protein
MCHRNGQKLRKKVVQIAGTMIKEIGMCSPMCVRVYCPFVGQHGREWS